MKQTNVHVVLKADANVVKNLQQDVDNVDWNNIVQTVSKRRGKKTFRSFISFVHSV